MADLKAALEYDIYWPDEANVSCNSPGCPCKADPRGAIASMIYPIGRRSTVREFVLAVDRHRKRYQTAEHGCGIPGCVNADPRIHNENGLVTGQ